MSVCYNCRTSVAPSAEQCPNCGIRYVVGTLRSPLVGLPPSGSGWGISATVLQSKGYRVLALLFPVWGSGLVASILGGEPVALALLLAPFVFIPGVLVVANMAGWSGFIRLTASLAYVVLSGVIGFKVLLSVAG